MEIQIEEIPEKEFSAGKSGKWDKEKIQEFVTLVLKQADGRGNVRVPVSEVIQECYSGEGCKYPVYSLMLQIRKLNPELKMKTQKNKPFETSGYLRFYGL